MSEARESNLAIQTIGVGRVYQTGGHTVDALKQIDLSIPVGRFVALKGKSGSGKTTLLNCIGGLDTPTHGEVLIHGQDISRLPEAGRIKWRQKEVGFIFQAFGLLPTLSVYENIELMLRIAGVPRRERRGRTEEVIGRVGLGQWQGQRPYEMSGGQQQRVAIARALVTRPKLILADEATGELDTQTTHEILQLLSDVAKEQQLTILLATHDGLVDGYVDEVVNLSNGRLQTRDV